MEKIEKQRAWVEGPVTHGFSVGDIQPVGMFRSLQISFSRGKTELRPDGTLFEGHLVA